MIANMNEKGRQTNLLAAIAVFAMVVCALAIVLPGDSQVYGVDGTPVLSEDGKTATVMDTDDLNAVMTDVNGGTGTYASVTTIALGANIEGSMTLSEGKTLTLDLNGYTLSGGTTPSTPAVSNLGTMTIMDSSDDDSGVIQRADNGSNSYYVIDNRGTMTITGGKVTNNSGSEDVWAGSSLIRNYGYSADKVATLNIQGGTYVQKNFIVLKNDDYGILNVTGGTISSYGGNTGTLAIQNWNVANISGATIEGAVTSWVWETTNNQQVYGNTITTIDASTTTFINGSIYLNYDTTYNKPITSPSVIIENGTLEGVVEFNILYGSVTGDVSLSQGSTIRMTQGTTYEGTVYGPNDAYANFDGLKAGVNGITIVGGSVEISGTIDATSPVSIDANGTISISGEVVELPNEGTVTQGGLTITSTGTGSDITIGDLTVNGDFNVEASVNVSGALVVSQGVTMTVAETAVVSVLSGEVVGTVSVAGTVTGAGTIAGNVIITSPDAIVEAEVTGQVKTDYPTDTNIYDALQGGTVTQGNGWTYNDSTGTLTLTNYDGNCYFYANNLKSVVLYGENRITITDAAIEAAINGEDGINYFAAIRGVISTGSSIAISEGETGATLTIDMTGEVNYTGDATAKYVYGVYSNSVTISADMTVNNDVTFPSDSSVTFSKSGIRGSDGVTVSQNANVSADVVGNVVVNAGSSLVTTDATVNDWDNIGGALIVSGTLTYSGNEQRIVYSGIAQQIENNQIYLIDNARINSTQGASVIVSAVTNPAEGVVVNTIEDANREIALGNDVTIASIGDVDISGLVGAEGVTVTIGSVIGVNDDFVGTIVSNNIDATLNGLDVETMSGTGISVTGNGDYLTVVGNGITATITTTTGTDGDIVAAVQFNNVTSVNGFTMQAGSVEISGELTFGTNGSLVDGTGNNVSGDAEQLVVTDNTTISGTGYIDVSKLTIQNGSTLTIGKNVTIYVSENSQLVIEQRAVITGEGKIVLRENATGITNNGTIDVEVESETAYTFTGSVDAQTFQNVANYYDTIYINSTKDFIISCPTTEQGFDLNVDGVLIYSNAKVVIGQNVYADFSNVTFYGATFGTTVSTNFDGAIDVKGELTISNSDIYADVQAYDAANDEDDGIVTVATPKTEVRSGTSVGNLGDVAFGNILEISGDYTISDRSNAHIFGTLNITGTLTVGQNSNIYIYGAGDFNVSGTVTLNGNLTLFGEAEVSGTMTVGTNGAIDTSGLFDVTGSLTINGTLEGGILNHGTVTFNGTASELVNNNVTAGIVGCDGSTTIILSVDGTLGITDYGAAQEVMGTPAQGHEDEYAYFDGNFLYVTDMAAATGASITVSVSVQSSVIENGNDDVTLYVATMDVSGIATADVAIEAASGVTVSQTLDITGDLTYMDAGEVIYLGNDQTIAPSTVDVNEGVLSVTGILNVDGAFNAESGTITVTGTGEISIEAEALRDAVIGGSATINATYYTISTAATTTTAATYTGYYAGFDSAILQIANADDDTVTVMGEQTVGADATIADGQTVIVSTGAKLTVGSGITLTVANGGVLEDNAYAVNTDNEPVAGVFVDGTLTFENYSTGYDPYNSRTYKVVADVVVVNEPARTFMSLAGAIGSGMTDIVLNQDVVIEDDLAIPVGTTVSSDRYGITVGTQEMRKDVTLTVEGAVELIGTNSYLDLVTDVKGTGNNVYDGALVVGGESGYVMLPETVAQGQTAKYYYETVGAHFFMDVTEGRNTVTYYVVSTVQYAAANSTSVADNEYKITITGQVTAENLVFTAPENMRDGQKLVIDVLTIDADNVSTFRFSEVVLGMDVELTASTTNGKSELTGAVVMNDADGNAASEVTLNRATGVNVYVHEEPETDTEAAYDCMEIDGVLSNGSVTISAGTVYIGETGLEVINGTQGSGPTADRNTGSLTIANGATLVVSDYDLKTTVYGDAIALTVDGTLSVVGNTRSSIDGAVINGTVSVTENSVLIIADAQVNGTIDVVRTDDYKNTAIEISGTLTVSTKPTELGVTAGAGTVNGYVDLETKNGIIKAYPGADLSGAYIDNDDVNGESLANSTVFNVNGEVYMTVYVSAEISVQSILFDEEFSLAGLDTGLYYPNGVSGTDSTPYGTGLYNITGWFSDASMAQNTALNSQDSIGEYDVIYANAPVQKVQILVSQGVGLTIYIDGLSLNNFLVSGNYMLDIGTHTVRFDVQADYNGDNAVITFNGQTVANGGTIEVTTESAGYVLACSGAVPAQSGSGDITVNVPSQDDGMSLTDILLIVLVILILVMAIIVALRLMRS